SRRRHTRFKCDWSSDVCSSDLLITGGAGYLGSILTPHLLSLGHQVTVLDTLMYGQAPLLDHCINDKFEFVYEDARDECTLRRQQIGRASCRETGEKAVAARSV